MIDKKAVLISGATGGLGLALTKAFLALDQDVLAIGRNFSRMKNEISHSKLHMIEFDFEKSDDLEKLEKITKDFNIQTVINAAGTSQGVGAIDEVSLDDWSINMQINLFSAIRVNNIVLPEMKRLKSGCIINVTSMAADKPLPWLAPYCVSKAALKHYTMCLSQEMRPFGIWVNSLGISADTFLYNDHRRQKQEKGYYGTKSAPERKMPTPEDNVPLFVFLSSEQARHISGQHIECHSDVI